MRPGTDIRQAQAADIAAIAHVHLASSKIAYRDILDPALLDGLSLDGRIALWERRFAQIGSQGRLWVQCAGAEMIGFALCDLPDDREAAPSVCEGLTRLTSRSEAGQVLEYEEILYSRAL